MRAALQCRMDRGVDARLNLPVAEAGHSCPPIEDEAGARAAEALVRCARHHMRELEWRRDHASRNETGNVRHVNH